MLFALLACAPADKDSAAGDAPTWYQDVAPVVVHSCTGCHQPGGAAFDLTNPEGAAAMSSAMAAAVTSGVMPPWGAFETDECTPTKPWKDDRRLSADEIALINAWAEGGAPLGDEATAAATEPPVALRLPDTTLDFAPEHPYTTVGEADELVCVSMDPGFTSDVWLAGVEVDPENSTIAHHTLVFVDEAAESATLGDSTGWYECSSGPGVGNAPLLATWVPGAPPTYAPDGTGMRVPAGSRLVLQMHYHPGGTVGAQDLPTLRLLQTDGVPAQELHHTLIGNAASAAGGLQPGPNDGSRVEFHIPPNVADHTETMLSPFDDRTPTIPIPDIGAHMHLLGTRMDVWVDHANPTGDQPASECMLSASRYDYDWQELYRYDVPLEEAPTISGGDTLRITCHYDNTLDHDGTRRALESVGLTEPVDVYLGEGTLDEMCIGVFGYVY